MCLVSLKTKTSCLLQWLYHFAFPPSKNVSSYCFIFLPAFIVVSVLDTGSSNSCEVVSHCYFNLYCSVTFDVEHLIVCLFTTCIHFTLVYTLHFFDEVSIKIFGPSLKLGYMFSYWWVLKSLCILNNNPLLDVSSANELFWSVSCLLILLTLSFTAPNF